MAKIWLCEVLLLSNEETSHFGCSGKKKVYDISLPGTHKISKNSIL